MSYNSLKTKITITLALLLLVAMFLIDFIVVMTSQRDFIRAEIARGELLLFTFQQNIAYTPETNRLDVKPGFMEGPQAEVVKSSFSCALIVDPSGNQVHFSGTNCTKGAELKRLVQRAVQTQKRHSRFFGSTWGVFWRQKQNVVIASPLYFQNRVIGGAGIVLPLDQFYNTLRRSQQIVIIYIFTNLVILTLFGVFRMYQLAVKPIHRLVKRAEEYGDDSQIVFLSEREGDEFGLLSSALNRMLSRISEDRDALQNSFDSLETANMEIKKAQRNIIRAEKLASVGRLSAGIAHEIGNPIGIVLGYLELLKQSSISEEERKEYIDRAESEVGRINSIISDLLNFSRPSKELEEDVSLHEIIEEVVHIIKVQPLMKSITIRLRFNAEIDTVQADPNQLRQIILNLLMNAADAISSAGHGAGEIDIHTRVVTDGEEESAAVKRLVIQFIDNGSGISSGNLENIFDPFFTTKEPGKGTGLGLSVSFMMIEQIGGIITAESTEDRGTTITINLPLRQA